MSLVRTGKIRTNFLGRLGVWRSSTCLNIKSMRTTKKLKKLSSVETVRETRNHLIWLSNDTNQGTKLGIKIETELSKLIREIKSILYGTNESEAVAEECENLTREFFKDNTLRLLIMCLPRLGLESRKDATQVVANLQRQQVGSHLIASIYLETNLDLVDYLISKSEDPDLGLHCGSMLRECIRHQNVTRHVLAPNHVRKFFDYIQLPSFDIAADATETFKVLLTRHKSTVSRFLSRNYEWFFQDYNSKLLESDSYFTKRTAVQLLREILLHPSNSAVMIRYVSSKDHLIILMNLLRDSSKTIRINAFHIFKLFIGNESKPEKITSILAANQIKLIRFFAGFKNDLDEDDEQFEDDKAEVVRQIAQLQL